MVPWWLIQQGQMERAAEELSTTNYGLYAAMAFFMLAALMEGAMRIAVAMLHTTSQGADAPEGLFCPSLVDAVADLGSGRALPSWALKIGTGCCGPCPPSSSPVRLLPCRRHLVPHVVVAPPPPPTSRRARERPRSGLPHRLALVCPSPQLPTMGLPAITVGPSAMMKVTQALHTYMA